MNRQDCEKLVPMGLTLYNRIVESEIDPVIRVLSGEETDMEMRILCDRAGVPYQAEKVVLGLALRGSKKDIALISAPGVNSDFQFLQVMWHEMGHCSYRLNNPDGVLYGHDDPAKLYERKMIAGVVEKFWDEAIAQCAANKVIETVPREIIDAVCPDYVAQNIAERNLLSFFLHKGIADQNGGSKCDEPLLKLMGIPFDPYCLAIYCAEMATNKLIAANRVDVQDGNPELDAALAGLSDLVLAQSECDNCFAISESRKEETILAFADVAKALGAADHTIQLMDMSLKDFAATLQK